MTDPYRRPTKPGEGPSASASEAISTWESSRACPDCSADAESPVRLFVAYKQGVAVEACGQCGGAWLERAQVTTLFDEGTGAGIAAELAALADRHASSARPNMARRCVECGGSLVQRTLHDVVVDVCALHGLWLDRGEIRAAVANMTTATLDELARSSTVADPDAIVSRGRLNAFLQDLAKDAGR